MPRGIPNQPKRVTAGEPEPASAAPMIIIQPQASATRLDAYNLTLDQIVDELRRALIHMVATNAGATIIHHSIPHDAAVAVPAAHKAHDAPSRNGASPKPKAPRHLPRELVEDLDDDR